ncbi:TPR-like protein [Plenodomus tracheiphilus IPT5]|uniref:TPR-like protein n=1 Tax=Plenodomus tracheiphilus IPT5 TaxID=1408161 RepID=A0A6A7AU91_9PLEO|nr:TPR-like protein [Plenodomus tracheiphilus IPT5]
MLERASTCLESGRRQLFRAPKPCLRQRHMLHSHVAHPSSMVDASPSPHAAPRREVRRRPKNKTLLPPARHNQRLLLDFLYPQPTLALLKQVPRYGPDAVEPRRRQLTPRVRQYSTATGEIPAGQTSADETAVKEAQTEFAALRRRTTPLKALRRILDGRPPGKQELVWLLYSAIAAPERTAEQHLIPLDVIEYLAQDGPPPPNRVLQLFQEIPASLHRPSSVRIAIEAYTSLRTVGPAIQLLEQIDANSEWDMLNMGLDVILRRTILDQQWDLSLRVFRTFLSNTESLRGQPTRRQIRFGDTVPELWRQVLDLPGLLDYVEAFLHYAREYKDEFSGNKAKRDTLAHFTMTFIPNVMGHVLNRKKPDENFIWEWFKRLFEDMHATGILPTTTCYEYAIMNMLNQPRYQDYTNKRKIWLELYRRYREDYLERAKSRVPTQKPSQSLIGRLIYYHGLNGGLGRIIEHVQDLRDWYPKKPLPARTLLHLIHTFSEHGEHVRVEEFLQELQDHYPQDVNLKALSARLFVHARRADVQQTLAQFQRIQHDYKLVPDIYCWNILLLAYVRADDLDGALECFNSCVDCGHKPDAYTFGPLLDLAAQRGDIEAFETLFSRAKQMGIDLESNARARSGYVECFLNAGDPDGAIAIAEGMLKSWQAGTLGNGHLTHTWNLLIQHYSLIGDLASAREHYRQMVENNIPLDSWTYGSLMRGLVQVKQTNAAYKILRVTMPQHNFRIHGFHYAIVMWGFMREGQHDLAAAAQRRMAARHIPQTPSLNKAALQVLGVSNLKALRRRGAKHPNYRLLTVEDALQEMLVASTSRGDANRQPETSRYIDPHDIDSIPQSYYGSLISLYTTRSAYAICKKLYRKAMEAAPDAENSTIPTTLATAIMEAHLKAGRHEEVARIWQLARASAAKLTKTFSQVVEGSPSDADPASLFSPLVRQRYEDARLANNRRQILVKPCRIYMRSLFAQSQDDIILVASGTIRDLLINGYIIDNFTWNEFIQQLATRSYVFEAFKACEEFLMPRFPGWRNLTPGYWRHNLQGYQWMELRHYDIKRSSVLPRYKTMVLLAKAFADVRADERNGIGYDEELRMWLSERLSEAAPLSMMAIESMPVMADSLQEKYFHSA